MASTVSKYHPWRVLVPMLLGVTLLAGWAFWPGQGNTPQLGLDLQGGTQVTLLPTASPGSEGSITDEQLDQAVSIIRQRVNGLGVAESEVTVQGSGDNAAIVVSVPGSVPQDRLVELVGRTAQLAFRAVEAITTPEGIDPNAPQTEDPQVSATPTDPQPTPTDGSSPSPCPMGGGEARSRRRQDPPAKESRMTRITVNVDGVSCTDEVEPRMLLVHYLREVVGKVGTVVGCDTSNCGACTVHLDGRSVKSCNMLAVQADGHDVTTIEGLSSNGELHPMQAAFHENHALQCGYCTPGMLVAARDIATRLPDADEDRVRLELAGNLCRCTGYVGIVNAILQVIRERRA